VCHKRLFSLAKLLSQTPETEALPVTAAGDRPGLRLWAFFCLMVRTPRRRAGGPGESFNALRPRVRTTEDARDVFATRCDDALKARARARFGT
jgi:hypothetical protein